jgi:membrane-bound lytic murein transglycosylase D
MTYVPGGRQKYQRTLNEDLIRSQTGIREKCREALRRSGRYIHAMERIFVQEYGLPVELTRIPFIESSFDYEAYSSVGAAGIWQFMRSTARLYMTSK